VGGVSVKFCMSSEYLRPGREQPEEIALTSKIHAVNGENRGRNPVTEAMFGGKV
jgi:hypothetical protein